MDPSTTLMTFMVQTSQETRSVHLVGSWDNFNQHYPMERDARRSHGQWRGCYSFKDITCEGDSIPTSKRTGGLKMGHTYWYYYELDDGTEIHDTSLPSTTSCPYLPGQCVNTLWVPIEVNPLRLRSASTGSVNCDYKTMNPADKFLKPRPPPAAPMPFSRMKTSPSSFDLKPPTPTPSGVLPSPRFGRSLWSPRSLFGLKSQADRDRDRLSSISSPSLDDGKLRVQFSNASMVKSDSGYYSRDASPESLYRQTSRKDFKETTPWPSVTETSIISSYFDVQYDFAGDDDEDDDHNFAASIRDDDQERVATTGLSPAPMRSRPTTAINNERKQKPLPSLPQINDADTCSVSSQSPDFLSSNFKFESNLALHIPRSHFSIDSTSSELDPLSSSTTSTAPSVLDDEEADYSADEEASSPSEIARQVFAGYSLPATEYGSELTLRKHSPPSSAILQETPSTLCSPRMTFGPVSRGNSPSTKEPMSALEEFLTELGYLGDAIQTSN